jgi:hypothetical protein
MPTFRVLAAATVAVCLQSSLAVAQPANPENYEAWALLQDTFESTSGQGIMIKGYDPVISGDKCSTNFTAVPAQGGTLCTNGKFRAVDGSASGTTPFRVFFKDGLRRRSP